MEIFNPADDNPEAVFNQDLADSYIGKHLLFGLTYCDHNENVMQQEQYHGEIIEITTRAMTVKLHGSDEIVALPPFIDELQPAPEGEYKLRSTGEMVVNPDLLGQFQRIAPPE